MNVIVHFDIAEYYLSLPWSWRFKEVDDPDGSYFEATVEEIPDFSAVSASLNDLAVDARDAFLSHIRSYLTTGKTVPNPRSGSPRTPVSTMRVAGMSDYAVAYK